MVQQNIESANERRIQSNTHQPMHFLSVVIGKIFILILYVDNILIFADSVEIARVITFMASKFKWITIIQEKTQSYLGMNVELQDHKIMVDKEYFTQQLFHYQQLKNVSS